MQRSSYTLGREPGVGSLVSDQGGATGNRKLKFGFTLKGRGRSHLETLGRKSRDLNPSLFEGEVMGSIALDQRKENLSLDFWV